MKRFLLLLPLLVGLPNQLVSRGLRCMSLGAALVRTARLRFLFMPILVVAGTSSVPGQPVAEGTGLAGRIGVDGKSVRVVPRAVEFFHAVGSRVGERQVVARVDSVLRDSVRQFPQDSGAAFSLAGFCFEYSSKTYVPSLRLRRQTGVYSQEISLPFTVLGKDTGGVVYMSWSTFVTAGIGLLGEAVAGELLGAQWLRLAIRYALFFPWAYLSSQHGLAIMGPEGMARSESSRLLFFGGTRLDCFGSANPWMRWTLTVGFQVEFKTGGGTGGQTSDWWGLSFGSEIPFDEADRVQAGEPRLFIGLRTYSPLGLR